MPLKMQRGRTQSLFRFLPHQTYNWQQGRGTFIGTDDVDAREMDVPPAWIRRALHRLLDPFVAKARQAGINLPALDLIDAGNFELLEPRKFRGEVFPRTYVCMSCNYFFRSDDEPHRCPSCHVQDQVQQWSFVEYHRCGHVSGLVPPQCRNGCRAGMRLTNRTSRSPNDWTWVCARCGTVADRGVFRGCGCASGQIRVLRADAGAVYYPQYVTVVNPPSRADYSVLDSDAVGPAAVAQALGALPAGLDGLRRGVNDQQGGDVQARLRRQLIDQFGLEDGDPLIEQMIQRQMERSARDTHWSVAVDDLHLAPEMIEELGFQSVELTLARESSPLTISDLIAQAPASMRPVYEVDYQDVLARYGFVEATLLREFPLAYIVAGYTREAREPEDRVLFNFFRPRGGSLVMYGQRTDTEALLFRLDPARVLRWLVDSHVVDDPGDVNPQAWLLSVMHPITSIFEEPQDRITSAVLGLVHSISHRTLEAVATRSGLSSDSLSEYLFPHNLAFLVYADTRSEFVLGGLEHVFRNYLADSLRHLDEDHRCVFDPPCRNRRGACAFCMYLSETSCERFNTALSRWYLFGGNDGSIQWRGFWTP